MSSVRARKSLTSQAVVCLQVGDGGGGDDDPAPEAMDMSWPSGARKRITYVLLAPIVFPLWLTLPDTRSPRGKPFHLFQNNLNRTISIRTEDIYKPLFLIYLSERDKQLDC